MKSLQTTTLGKTVELEVICRVCNDPFKVTIALTGNPLMDDAAISLAKITVHNSCSDLRRAQNEQRSASGKLILRVQSWGGICPTEYQDTEFERIPSVNKKLVMKWQFGKVGLMVFGKTGKGKTRSVFKLLEREYLTGRVVVAMTHTVFTQETVFVWKRESKNAQEQWIATLKTCDIFFVDDLGQSRFTDAGGNSKHAEEMLFDVCDVRMHEGRPCIFTSNANNGGELEKRMSELRGPAFVRRIREFCTPIHF